jgi:hypothetical protein
LRQIHLDFHTSSAIDPVGDQFDPEEFAKTLEDAHVDSITLFSRCHHGNLYYDSKLFPQNVHPHLQPRNLLEQQVHSCHAHGIAVNVYTTIRWDKRCADEHPEWVCINPQGALDDYKGKGYFEAGFYKNLCINTGYRDYLKKQLQEVLQMVPAEGVWFDAAFLTDCCCPTCIRKMQELGLDPTDSNDRRAFSLQTYADLVKELSTLVRQINPKLNIFYNKGHVGFVDKAVQDYYSYFAFESLPGGEWGYMDFPLCAKYVRNFGKRCLGMTGRFHTEWGDFHSYRNKAALEFECYSMLANGCDCIIGDQLTPNGKLDSFMYKEIGDAFASVEQKDPWCEGAVPVVEIGLFTEEEFTDSVKVGHLPKATEGAARILMQLSYQFDIIDSTFDFSKYKLLILPDSIPVSKPFARKLSMYVAEGGKLLCSYHAGLLPNGDAFAMDLGVTYRGEAPYSPDFIIPTGRIGEGLCPSEHVMYRQGALVEVSDTGKLLANTTLPVFNRTWEHFCSHLHSPSSGKLGYPAIVCTEHSIYFIHPVFSLYQYNATPWCRTFVRNALRMLIMHPLVQHSGPTTIITNLMTQDEHERWVLHLLHYVPERSCDTMDIVDTVIPLHDINCVVWVPRAVKSVSCVPECRQIPFTYHPTGELTFCVPEVKGHQMIEINFATSAN